MVLQKIIEEKKKLIAERKNVNPEGF